MSFYIGNNNNNNNKNNNNIYIYIYIYIGRQIDIDRYRQIDRQIDIGNTEKSNITTFKVMLCLLVSLD